MSTNYNNVLERLKEERIRLSLSQNEVARTVHMTQSNYSKVELGLRRLGYDEIKYLCESEFDVYYIFTGHRSKRKYTEFLTQCGFSELCYYLCIMHSVVALRKHKSSVECRMDSWERIQYVPLVENRKSQNIFLALRHSMNCQQKMLADELGVDIKKYRNLEKGRGLPDSELLWRLYDLFRISPMFLLKDESGLAVEISSLLEDAENGDIVFEIIKNIREMD